MDYDTLKQALETEQTRVKQALSELGKRNPTDPDDYIATAGDETGSDADENVVADRAEEYETREGELNELETRLRNVERALNKMESGTYGTCEVCNAQIEAARLAVNPAARTCIAHMDDEANLAL